MSFPGYSDADLADGGSDRLIDEIAAVGDESVIVERFRAHLAAGADHVLLQPVGGDVASKVADLARLAPAVVGVSSASS